LPDEVKVASFNGLSLEEQRRILTGADKDFAGLPLTEQNKVLATLSKDLETYRRKRLANAFEFALIPPAVGYALFFVVLPWIAAGFRPARD